MKKITHYLIILLSIFIFNSQKVQAQIVNIPDANFKAALVGNSSINTNGDNEIQLSEASAYYLIINVSYNNISDLTGIEAFTSLHSLYCSNNQLTSLDVSALTTLTNINCSSNQLSSLDVSSNINLHSLYCGLNQLSNLNLTTNLNLSDLSCYNNQLTSLDLSHNTLLTRIDCIGNQLTTLDLSSNILLTSLSCSSNQLTTLDLTPLPLLDELYCQHNHLTYLSEVPNVMSVFYIPFNQIHCLNNLPQVSTVSQNNIFGNPLTCVPNQTNYSLGLPLCVANDSLHNPYHCGDNSCSAHYDLIADSALQSVWYLVNQCYGSDSLSSDSINYVWSWGDSLNSTSTGSYPSFTYSSPGNYVICVTINDPITGCSSTYCDSSTYINKSISNQMIQVNVVAANSPLLTNLETPSLREGWGGLLYPNPSTGIFTFKNSSKINTVEVYNMYGEVILRKVNCKSIDLTDYPKGVYFAKVNGTFVSKLVKE